MREQLPGVIGSRDILTQRFPEDEKLVARNFDLCEPLTNSLEGWRPAITVFVITSSVS